MAALATAADLAVRLGVEFSEDQEARVDVLLADVSAEVEAEIGRTFTSTPTTFTGRPCCGILTLPNGPVSAVASVEDADENAVSFSWVAGRTITVSGSYGPVTVAYTYGWEAVPLDIVALVCQIAGRAFGTNAADGAKTQEGLGGYSFSTGVIAAAGTLGRLPAEQRTIDRYKRSTVGTITAPSWLAPRPV